MKPVARYLLLFFVYWLIVFTVSRAAFVSSILGRVNGASFGEFLHAFYAGFFLDLSTASYCIILPAVLAVLFFIARARWIALLNDAYVSFLIVIYCLIAFGELCLYTEWKTKLNTQAILHFAHPAEVFESASLGITLLFFTLVILFSIIFVILYQRRFSLKRISFKATPVFQRIILGIVFLGIFLGLNIIAMRGGLKAIPISESDAYFSKYRMLNDAAVNPAWSLGHNAMEYSAHQKENPYHVMPDSVAEQVLKTIYHTDYDSTQHILTIDKPNIVFLILESFTAYSIPAFGGDPFCMFLDSLANKGLAFTGCYSAGYVSDQGIPALLSSYPCAPHTAVINQTTKSVNLPCINKDLKKLGYNSGFYFGGQLNYGNIKSYLYNMEFDIVKERKDFTGKVDEGKLGIHDGSMQKLFLKEVNKSKPPFLACWFTLSSHSPYDIPEPIREVVKHRQNTYVNTMMYTDRALKKFFAEAEKQTWFKNTLFVIVADHSHENHRSYDFNDKNFHRIPLILYGDVLKHEYRGKKIEYTISQLDIVPTLLHQLNLSSESYPFGKNILNPATKLFAYYYYFGGTGFITDSCFASFGTESRSVDKTDCRDSVQIATLKKINDAFVQTEYQDYLSR